jgi:hypothetical protein
MKKYVHKISMKSKYFIVLFRHVLVCVYMYFPNISPSLPSISLAAKLLCIQATQALAVGDGFGVLSSLSVVGKENHNQKHKHKHTHTHIHSATSIS